MLRRIVGAMPGNEGTMSKRWLPGIVVACWCAMVNAQVPVPGTPVTAVEYFHAGFGHYFVTAQADEIAGIDAGLISGWTRTGQTFDAWASGSGLADVCRFFTTAFAPKSSHFYTARAAECDLVKQNPVWQYEKIAFKVALPAPDGSCPVGVPLYRLFNNGLTGAPNHRYTTSLAIRAQMLAAGFVAEDDNTVCVASGNAPPSRTSAEGLWIGSTPGGRAVVVVVLDDGTFAAIYTVPQTSVAVAGVIQGSSTADGAAFASSDGKDFGFVTQSVGPGAVSATYVPMGSMSGVLAPSTGGESFTATYNPGYDHPANLAEAAGEYSVALVMTTHGIEPSTLTISAAGAIGGTGASGCTFTGTATPRGSVNLFDVSFTFGGGACLLGTATIAGVAYYEPAIRQFAAVAPTATRSDLMMIGGFKPAP
jgi:hypothetical protein